MKNWIQSSLFTLTLLLLGSQAVAQTAGDWRTIAAGGALTWSNQAHWERYNGSTWVATPGAYPGQGGADGIVTVRTNGSPTVTMDVSPNAFGSLVVEAGATVAVGAQTLNVNNGISGAGSVTVSSGSIYASAAGNATGDITVNTLTATGAASIYVVDSWTVTNFTAATSTVYLTGGTGNDISGNPTFYNLTVDPTETGGITLNSNISLADGGALTISANVTFNPNNFTVTSLGTNSLSMSTGQLNVTGSFSFGTQFVGFDTISLTGGTVYYVGTTQNITGMTYYNLAMAGTGTSNYTATGNIVVHLDLTIGAADVFNLQTNDLEIWDDILMTNTSSTLTATGGTVTMNGNDQDVVLQNGVYSLNNLVLTQQTVTATRTTTVSQDITLSGNLSMLNPNGSPTFFHGVNLTGFSITGTGGSNVFALGEHTRLRSTAANVGTFINTFETLSDGFNTGGFSANSYVWLESGSAQDIPVLNGTYGGLLLGSASAKTVLGDITITGPLFATNTAGQSLNDGGFTITIGGGFTKAANLAIVSTGTFSFAGSSQTLTINGSPTFNNIEFLGSTNATIIPGANFTIAGDFTIASGPTVTVTTNNFTIDFTGSNWSVSGLFQPATGTINFAGTGAQTLDMFSSGNDGGSDPYFWNLTISNTNVAGVTATQDFEVNNTFTLAANSVFDITGISMYVAGSWTRNTGSAITTTNSEVVFDGGSTQNIASGGVAFNTVTMRNAGTKTLSNNNSLVLNGDMNIEGGANFNNDFNDEPISITGDWNNFGTYVPGGATVTFNGVNQSLGGLFYSIQLSNGGVKTLNAQLDVDGLLTVDSGVELDVTTGNYTISLNGAIGGTEWGFASGSVFTPRQGLVTFTGGGKNITTRGMAFYNLTLNMTSNAEFDLANGTGNLVVTNDLNVQSGDIDLNDNTLTIGGDLTISSGVSSNIAHTGVAAAALLPISFNAASGSVNVNFGDQSIIAPVVFSSAGGATYNFTGNLTSTYNNAAQDGFNVVSGSVVLETYTVTLADVTTTVQIDGGSLTVGENGTLQMPAAGVITNDGGTFLVQGTTGNLATVSGGTSGYTVTLNSGSFGADYFVFNQLVNNGITFNGTSFADMDGGAAGVQGLQNGSFGDHRGGANGNYLTIAADMGAPVEGINVSFSQGLATYNVERSDNGANDFTFIDANGAFAGESFDNLTGTGLVVWTFPGGVTWTGNVDVDGSPGDGSSWNDSNNWSTNSVPGPTDYVILDHSTVSGTYSVSITGSDATSGNMSLSSPSNTVTLTIGAGRTLDINGDLDLGANCTITQTDNTSLITISGSWSQASASTFNDGSSTVTFDGDAVNETISIPGSESFFNLVLMLPTVLYIQWPLLWM